MHQEVQNTQGWAAFGMRGNTLAGCSVEMILGLILYHISIQYHGSPPPPLPPKGKIVPILDQCQKYFQTLTLILTLSLAYLTGAKCATLSALT